MPTPRLRCLGQLRRSRDFRPRRHSPDTTITKKPKAKIKTDSLHAELRGEGISVTALCPGPVKTEFTEAAGGHPAHEVLPKFMIVPSRQVAKAGIDALVAGKRVVVPGPMRGAIASGKLTP